MKIKFDGTLEEFTAVFRGLALEFELDDSDEIVEESLSYRGSGPPAPVEVQQEESFDTPLGEREAIPFPQNKLPSVAGKAVKSLSLQERAGCLKAAKEFFCAWVEGFGDAEAAQPNRLGLTETIGSGQWTVPFLLLCYEHGSLQKFCGLCLTDTHRAKFPAQEDGGEEQWWNWIDQVSCNIIQVSVAGFPDVQGTYDYSTRWKREALGESS